MSLTNIEIPDSLYQRVQQLASQQQVTIDQFIATAIAEKTATIEKDGYIASRANRAQDEKFVDAISQIPHTEPAGRDKL